MNLRAALLLIVAASAASARRLPIQIFTSAQGLPRNSVACLVPTRSGLLWLCTSEGLVRFDGSRFRVFDTTAGLPSRRIRDLVPSRNGGFWIVTDRGVCRLPAGSLVGEPCRLLAFDRLNSEYIGEFQNGALLESKSGETWVATTKILFRVSKDGRKLERAPLQLRPSEFVSALAETPSGALLITTGVSVLEWRPGFPARDLTGTGGNLLLPVSPEEAWVAGRGFYRFSLSSAAPSARRELGEPFRHFDTLLRRRDGSVWAAGSAVLGLPGLWRLGAGADGRPTILEAYSKADGLPSGAIYDLAEDTFGNLWGASRSGVFRLANSGFVTYDGGEIDPGGIRQILEDPAGRLCLLVAFGKRPGLLVKNGDRFQPVPIRIPASQTYFGWASNRLAVLTHDAEWWFALGQALLRFPRLNRTEDLMRIAPVGYGEHSPLGCREVFRAEEDSGGDMWIGCLGPDTLTRWERKSGHFHRWTAAEGWSGHPVTVIREGPRHSLWIGTYNDVARFRDGRFESFALTVGPPNPLVTDLLVDHAGRVWISTGNAGLFRCDNPSDPVPLFRSYTVREGLSSNATSGLVEDSSGLIYVGTVRALDRIDPEARIDSRRVRHFTSADGLPPIDGTVGYRDRRGHLWFGVPGGVAEFDPSKAVSGPPPEIYLSRIRVRGEDVPLPWEGGRSLSLNLAANRNQVEIEYAALDLRSPDSVRYQYRLSADSQWSEPVEQLSVNYASLPRGSVRFEARAIDADGHVSPSSAVMNLFVESPVWLQWWFLMAIAASLAGVGALLYRYRVRHLLAVERLRTHIATDLHDDLGASLSQISILSELARNESNSPALAEIAEIARSMANDMRDIVWAISPKHDRLDGLVHRMRRFAGDTLNGRNIGLSFETARLGGDAALPLEIRRPLYLVFKEAIHNVARHSGAAQAVIRVAHEDGCLKLVVEDDGRGFDPAKPYEGEGLASIARRMAEVGGRAHWDSTPGCGTRFEAMFPLRPRTRPHKYRGRPGGNGG